ncbi:MAG: hypothetical protein Q4A55_03930 [Aerococcus sp.]|nr:hypothetical protein [Aerococcus sp.]
MNQKKKQSGLSLKNMSLSQLISAAFTLFTLYKSLRSIMQDLKKK